MIRIRTIEISVGAFLVAGALAIVFLVVRVSGINPAAGGDTYTLHARFDEHMCSLPLAALPGGCATRRDRCSWRTTACSRERRTLAKQAGAVVARASRLSRCLTRRRAGAANSLIWHGQFGGAAVRWGKRQAR